MSKHVGANDKILYAWVDLQITATACHLKEDETSFANLFIAQSLQSGSAEFASTHSASQIYSFLELFRR